MQVCTDLSFPKGIRVYCLDATTIDNQFLDQIGTFDIIIDDASHNSLLVVGAFERFFPILKVGGMYIVEDVQESYKVEHSGGLKASTSTMEYFKGLADLINFYYIPISEQPVFDSDYLSKYGEENLNYFVSWIKSVLFMEVLIVVAKRSLQKTEMHRDCMTGKNSLVINFSPQLLNAYHCFDEPLQL